MTWSAAPVRLLLAAAALSVLALPSPASAQGGATTALASHRAVYDLKLSSTRGKRAMNAVRGRILYDFSGSACEGYALQFRQVSELDSGEGKVIVSDLRATSWEDGAAKRLRFHSQNYFDDNLRDQVDGQAEREGDGVAVELKVTGAGAANIPSDAGAVVLNVTVDGPQQTGHITVYPCGEERPTTSTLNYTKGTAIANASITKVGAGGKVCLYTLAPTHLIADVTGWFPAT